MLQHWNHKMPSLQVNMSYLGLCVTFFYLKKKYHLYTNIMGLHNAFVVDSSLPNLCIFCFGLMLHFCKHDFLNSFEFM
jgi:hypothetical protein